MNILILSGGTGSVALQTGLWELYGNSVDVKVLTNLYDNGKSTGAVRRVFDGKILGPSDLRKNQTLRHYLMHGSTPLMDFLDLRFDKSTHEAEKFCLEQLHTLLINNAVSPQKHEIMLNAVKCFFASPKARQISYFDFSISNIIYAGLAALNDYSMEKAGTIMADILNIPDCVIPNSDESLFLHAITESGIEILDEGEIVDWNNPTDKIKRIKLIDAEGNSRCAELSERAVLAIRDADVIILSSGTLWSSLIPTYATDGFIDAIAHNYHAKKYMVVNNVQDKDMIGVTAMDMINDILPAYLDYALSDFTFVFNSNASKEMQLDVNRMQYKYIVDELSEPNHKKHVAKRLALTIMSDVYSNYVNCDHFAFDFDDTIVGRNQEFRKESLENLSMIWRLAGYVPVSICTGNYAKHVLAEFNSNKKNMSPFVFNVFLNNGKNSEKIKVYADGGINKYTLDRINVDSSDYNHGDYVDREFQITADGCLDNSLLISNEEIKEILDELAEVEIDVTKVQNRNFATLSIKPIENEYRNSITHLIKFVLNDSEYFIRPTGKTTIDISKHGNNKALAMGDILSTYKNAAYVGDEGLHSDGNDYIVACINGVEFLNVNNPRDTLVFLRTLFLHLNKKSVFAQWKN